MSLDRSDLINQLAASMGAGQFAATSYEGSRYDAETGTLYCNGMAISANVANDAIKHFSLLKSKCNENDPASKRMAMIYQCAIKSIEVMQSPQIKEFLKEAGSDILN